LLHGQLVLQKCHLWRITGGLLIQGPDAGFHLRLLQGDRRTLRLLRLYPGTQIKPVTRTVLVPRPKPATVGAAPVIDAALVAWAREVIGSVILEPIGGT